MTAVGSREISRSRQGRTGIVYTTICRHDTGYRKTGDKISWCSAQALVAIKWVDLFARVSIRSLVGFWRRQMTQSIRKWLQFGNSHVFWNLRMPYIGRQSPLGTLKWMTSSIRVVELPARHTRLQSSDEESPLASHMPANGMYGSLLSQLQFPANCCTYASNFAMS